MRDGAAKNLWRTAGLAYFGLESPKAVSTLLTFSASVGKPHE
jgi:hypothetical protein